MFGDGVEVVEKYFLHVDLLLVVLEQIWGVVAEKFDVGLEEC